MEERGRWLSQVGLPMPTRLIVSMSLIVRARFASMVSINLHRLVVLNVDIVLTDARTMPIPMRLSGTRRHRYRRLQTGPIWTDVARFVS
jgi:hypothetical protein